MEKRTRYNELLGIPNAIRDPDLYQLLGFDRGEFDAAQVEDRYRERMSTLQGIKSPKHKSFIEFLKGELRRARSVLVDDKQRQAYDLELLEERREQLTRILDIVLADGVLRTTEERRFQDMAAEVGLTPGEVEAVLSEELERRGAQRDSALGAVDRAAEREQTEHPGRTASSSDIQRAISRTLPPSRPPPPPPARPRPAPQQPPPDPHERRRAGAGRPVTRGAPPAPYEEEEEEIVAELVEEAPPEAAARFRSETPGAAGWGRATVVHVLGVCSSCLTDVIDQDVTSRRAERLEDGRLHCPACFNRLVAGLICGACYQRVTRSDMKGGRLKVVGGRVHHAHCMGG